MPAKVMVKPIKRLSGSDKLGINTKTIQHIINITGKAVCTRMGRGMLGLENEFIKKFCG